MHLTEITMPKGVPRDTQAVHRTVLGALDTDAPGRVLWAMPHPRLLVVQASVPVRADRIGGATQTHSIEVREKWATGDRVRIALIGNPTSTPRHGRSRVPLAPDLWADWLTRKLDGAVRLDHIDTQRLGKRGGRKPDGTRVCHLLVAFSATGVVTGPDRLADLILGGVGAGKAYGAGLLLVSAR